MCPACRSENRQGAKFCDRCGAALPRACVACGTALRPHARFCDECGRAVDAAPGGVTGIEVASPGSPGHEPPWTAARPAAIAAPGGTSAADVTASSYTPKHLADKILRSRSALEGERKQVTVLFADCAGFPSLSSRLDPEDLHAIMDGCFARISEAVHRYEGTVNQFTGDGVMALFGAPIAHEDHAVRAVAAALAAQKEPEPYRERL